MPSPWEVSVLRRLDAAVLPLLAKRGGASNDDEPEIEVEADDMVGVRSVMSALRARSKVVFAKPQS